MKKLGIKKVMESVILSVLYYLQEMFGYCDDITPKFDDSFSNLDMGSTAS